MQANNQNQIAVPRPPNHFSHLDDGPLRIVFKYLGSMDLSLVNRNTQKVSQFWFESLFNQFGSELDKKKTKLGERINKMSEEKKVQIGKEIERIDETLERFSILHGTYPEDKSNAAKMKRLLGELFPEVYISGGRYMICLQNVVDRIRSIPQPSLSDYKIVALSMVEASRLLKSDKDSAKKDLITRRAKEESQMLLDYNSKDKIEKALCSDLERMESLTSLDYRDEAPLYFPLWLRGFENLTTMDIHVNDQPDFIWGTGHSLPLPNLVELGFTKDTFLEEHDFSSLLNLKTLSVSIHGAMDSCDYEGGCTFIKSPAGVEELFLSGGVAVKDFKHLLNLMHLEVISISGTDKDLLVGLQCCENLYDLSLYAFDQEGNNLDQLGVLPGVNILNLKYDEFYKINPKLFPNLRELNIFEQSNSCEVDLSLFPKLSTVCFNSCDNVVIKGIDEFMAREVFKKISLNSCSGIEDFVRYKDDGISLVNTEVTGGGSK
jgi:hypothetical protein